MGWNPFKSKKRNSSRKRKKASGKGRKKGATATTTKLRAENKRLRKKLGTVKRAVKKI